MCSLEKGKKWKYLIFTAAESSMAAHGKAQLVPRLTATIRAEQPAGSGTSEAPTKQHQVVSLVPSSHLAPVLPFPAHCTVKAHPSANAASSGSLSDMGATSQPGLCPSPTAQTASPAEEGTIWETEQILSHLTGTFSKTDHSQD